MFSCNSCRPISGRRNFAPTITAIRKMRRNRPGNWPQRNEPSNGQPKRRSRLTSAVLSSTLTHGHNTRRRRMTGVRRGISTTRRPGRRRHRSESLGARRGNESSITQNRATASPNYCVTGCDTRCAEWASRNRKERWYCSVATCRCYSSTLRFSGQRACPGATLETGMGVGTLTISARARPSGWMTKSSNERAFTSVTFDRLGGLRTSGRIRFTTVRGGHSVKSVRLGLGPECSCRSGPFGLRVA